MNPQDFVYWLQGYFELQDPHDIGVNQTKMIRDHLKLVFENKTQEYPGVTETVRPYPIPYPSDNVPLHPFQNPVVTCATEPKPTTYC